MKVRVIISLFNLYSMVTIELIITLAEIHKRFKGKFERFFNVAYFYER